MAKVLISFLGVNSRNYWPANYLFMDGTKDVTPSGVPDGKVISSSFIAKALKEYYSIDKLILIGTAHSMWEEVYLRIGTSESIMDEKVWERLSMKCESSNHLQDNLDDDDIKEIEKRLGGGSKVIIIKYGLDNEEIAYNTKKILNIEKSLNSGDKIYLDITHSFRSLPIYLMNCLIYLKNVSSKNITIESISYGMLDVSKEYHSEKKNAKGEFCEFYTPVVELKKLMEVQDWITGAYNFKEFGNTYKLSELLKKDRTGNYTTIANAIKRFADVKNLNYLKEFRSGISNLMPLCNRNNLPELGKEIIAPVMEKFTNRFPQNLKQSTFQYRMADWHYKHYNYGFALTVLIEAIVTYCCELYFSDTSDKEQLEYNINSKDNRDLIKDALNGINNEEINHDKMVDYINDILKTYIDFSYDESNYGIFKSNWSTANKDRNNIVHNKMGDKHYSDVITDLEKNIEYFRHYIGK